jgi:hypothetical protein
MRTTVDIDDDVLAAAKDLAKAEGRTMGQVISDLVRRALTQPGLQFGLQPGLQLGPMIGMQEAQVAYTADDFPAFPFRGDGSPITSDMVRRLADASALEDAEAWDHGQDQPRAGFPVPPVPLAPKAGRG